MALIGLTGQVRVQAMLSKPLMRRTVLATPPAGSPQWERLGLRPNVAT
jgi:hypothetical protein